MYGGPYERAALVRGREAPERGWGAGRGMCPRPPGCENFEICVKKQLSCTFPMRIFLFEGRHVKVVAIGGPFSLWWFTNPSANTIHRLMHKALITKIVISMIVLI